MNSLKNKGHKYNIKKFSVAVEIDNEILAY